MEMNSKNPRVNPDYSRPFRWRGTLLRDRVMGYYPMWKALHSAAERSEQDGNLAEEKVLTLLTRACWMNLCPENHKEPFEPPIEMSTSSQKLSEYFSAEDVKLLSELVEDIDDVLLRARVADLVWVLKKDYRFALIAIDSYMEIPVEETTWWEDGKKCWHRAIDLTKRIERDKGDRLSTIEEKLLAYLMRGTRENGKLTLSLAQLMLQTKICASRAIEIAVKLMELGEEFEQSGEFCCAAEYYDASDRWFRTMGDKAKAAEPAVRCADALVKFADAQMSAETPIYALSAILYGKAIEKHRDILRGYYCCHKVHKRIREIHTKLIDAYMMSLKQMPYVVCQYVDTTEFDESAIKTVRCKSPRDSLLAFANIYQGACVQSIREKVVYYDPKRPLSRKNRATKTVQ